MQGEVLSARSAPVPWGKEQSVEVPNFVFQDRTQQRTSEQFADFPAAFKAFSHERLQELVGGQNIDNSRCSCDADDRPAGGSAEDGVSNRITRRTAEQRPAEHIVDASR